MRDWIFINANRVRGGHFASDETWGFNGAFEFALPGEARRIYTIASDGMGFEHVSVSFGPNHRTPSWELMCQVKDLFFEDEHLVVQYHPPKSTYVNNHPGCLHLWRCLDREMPAPPRILVGLQGVGLREIQKLKGI